MAAPEGVRGKILLAAQEITFAKVLAGNDKPTRDRGVKRLRKWLTARSEGSLEFSEEDHLTLWKGLFYCMWMSDKPLVQEDLAEQISNLIHCFKKSHQGILFMKCFFQTMAREWFGIDQFRLDKFMMLVRRCVRQLFTFCFNHGWTPKSCEEVCNLFESVLINSPNNAIGLVLHVSDIVLEELAKAGGGENVILHVIKPWAKLIGTHHDKRIRQHVVDRVFHHLIRQSNLGIQFQDKFDAWKEAGFPGNSWREMEAVEVGDDGNEDVNTETSKHEKILDPRAGKVDVELPQIIFEPEEVSNFLHEEQSKALLLRGRKALRLLSSQFKQLSEGHYPLGFKKPPGSKQKLGKRKAEGELWDAAEGLLEYESEIIHNEKLQRDGNEKGELVQPHKKMKFKKVTAEGFLSKSKKKRLRMKQAKQNSNKTIIPAKVKTSLTNKDNCENLLGDLNGITHKITPAKKHQKQIKCVPEAEILGSMEADSCNDEHKSVESVPAKAKKKRQSSKERKSPKLNIEIQKKSKKSPLKEVLSNNEIKLIASPSSNKKKNKVSTDIKCKQEDCILSTDSVCPQVRDSDLNSTSTELEILGTMQADICNEEDKPVVSKMQLPIKRRQSSEERKSPKLNIEIQKKAKKSPLKDITSNNEIKPIGSPSPTLKKNKVSTDIEGVILSSDSVFPDLHDFNSNSIELAKVEGVNEDVCTNLKTPLKHKNSPVLIKEPITGGSLRRSLRIMRSSKTDVEQTPIGRTTISKRILSSAKSKKARLSDCQSETSFVGSQVGAVLVQKFESVTGEGSKEINQCTSVCEQQQISSEPIGMTLSYEKTPVTKKVSKIKARKSINNSTPQQNASLKLESSGKKVNIVLKKNMSQGFMEYEQAVRNSPDIPFDASKKPIQGVLKPTSVPSPLNPFYKLNKIKL